MARFSLHTVGKDQHGIIARVTVTLAELGANLEESNMTIFRGQSAIMLVLEVPDIEDGRQIERALESVAEDFNLFVTVCPMPNAPIETPAGESFLVSVDGADRPGIVPRVTSAIADLGANVIDLTSRPVQHDGDRTFVLRLSVVLPESATRATLESAMDEISGSLQVEHSVRPWSGELAWALDR